ncbi:MAG: DNA internalization-related competence protein ComEC/Rec2 [Eggerthellaceae bacterium]|jgi:competence protein ComEC|nr:DNA internalization-related competence protein ComEC/Rec2 [Eggerthellaceae bacterium]MDR2722040.1 DNA internalization-related competence protein ComEC/Rec2 [Coriobacteriaceae bacterium]
MEHTREPSSKRPFPLPLLFVALGLWASSAVVYQYSLFLSPPKLWLFFAVSLLAIALSIAAFAKYQRRRSAAVFLVLLGISLGVACGSLGGISTKSLEAEIPYYQEKSYRFEIIEDVHETPFARSVRARTELPSGKPFFVNLTLTENKGTRDTKNAQGNLFFGDVIKTTVILKPPANASTEYYWQKNTRARAALTSYEAQAPAGIFGIITTIRKAGIEILKGFEGPGAILLSAILTGERSALDASGLYGSIRVAGLAHLVAVSGAHLSIVAAFIALLLRLVRIPRVPALIIQLVFIGTYLVFTGMQISAVRAAFMAIIVALSFFSQRRASSINALSLCIIAMVASKPATALSLSFLLSASSTLSIIVLARLFGDWCTAVFPRIPIFVRESASLSLASSVVVVPLSAAFFSQVSLIAPLSNIIVTPLFALLCTAGLLVLCLVLVVPALSAVLFPPLLVAAQGFCEIVSVLANIPHAAIPADMQASSAVLLGLLIFSLLWYTWYKPSKKQILRLCAGFGMVGIAFLFAAPFMGNDELVMLDVGQGDAFLVKSKGACVLVDTGENKQELLAGLARHFVYHLDAVIITHPDNDHCGALEALGGVVKVDSVCLARPLFACSCKNCAGLLASAENLAGEAGLVPLEVGDSLRLKNLVLTVAWPDDFSDKGGNADSLCLLLETTGEKPWRALLCGDLEAKEMNMLLDKERVGDIDLLKVGHHGAKVALDERSATRLCPEIALVSVGATNRYGHPSTEVLELLELVGCEIFRSDEVGDVVCKFTNEKISVWTLG